MSQTLPDNWEQIIMEFPENELRVDPGNDEMEPAPKWERENPNE